MLLVLVLSREERVPLKHLYLLQLASAVVVCLLSVSVSANVEPPEGAELSRIHVQFEWEQVGPADEFDIQVAIDGSDPFQFPIVDERVPSPKLLIVEGLEFGSQYRWRVRNVLNGVAGVWYPDSAFSIREISDDFGLQVEVEFGASPPQPGITLFNHCDDIVGYDLNGNLVLSIEAPARVSDCKLLGDGRVLFVGGSHAWILSLDGDLLWQSPDGLQVHHCASMMPSGNVLMLCREYQEVDQDGQVRTWQGDRVVEMDISTNEEVWSWSTFDYYNTIDYDIYQTNYWNDWTHFNDAHYVEADDSIYISCRHLSRITRIDYATKEIVYNLGMNLPSGDTVVGDDLFSYQHSPQLLPNGNMVLFDNGNRRGGEPAGANGMTRAIEISLGDELPPVDPQIVWSWETPVYCPSTGDADRLANGNTLVTSTQLFGVYEVDLSGGLVWKLSMVETEACPGLRPGYRATRVSSLYGDPTGLCQGDANGNGQVDVSDILLVLDQWQGSGSADVNGDGVVNVNDVLVILSAWGDCDD
ncbi:MAG: aryl-sulfate sulfotransferase [Phycisphaerales bacterium]|nr:aryl-sulfate sulfotransferase [Phycisphaerales bacterium]